MYRVPCTVYRWTDAAIAKLEDTFNSGEALDLSKFDAKLASMFTMGFGRYDGLEALLICDMHEDRAVDYLLKSDTDKKRAYDAAVDKIRRKKESAERAAKAALVEGKKLSAFPTSIRLSCFSYLDNACGAVVWCGAVRCRR